MPARQIGRLPDGDRHPEACEAIAGTAPPGPLTKAPGGVSIAEGPSRLEGMCSPEPVLPLDPREIDEIVRCCAAFVARRSRLNEDDLCSEGGVLAVEFLLEWKPERGAARAYLKRRLMWSLLDAAKKERRRDQHRGPYPETAEISRGLWSDGCAVASPEDRVFAAEALACLTERERRVMTLRCWDGLNNEEIAAALGVSVNTVERAVASAAERVRKMVDGRRRCGRTMS